MKRLQIVLISTYELGRQPFGLASPAAWLRAEGMAVSCQDLAIDALDTTAIQVADLVAFYLPMHTATRIASPLLQKVKTINPRVHLCCYGLYAPLNERYLRALGVDTILGGEFEESLVALAKQLSINVVAQSANEGETLGNRSSINGYMSSTTSRPSTSMPIISLQRQRFLPPERNGLPSLQRYATLDMGDGNRRTVGYTEATRGCKHSCRHCPIVPVYGGQFRVVQRDVVMADIRRQVANGAEHITFGDPDFFNGPSHAMRIVQALHSEFPTLTYDVTIKIEHLLQQGKLLPQLQDTGCLFITSAVEAVDDHILQLLNKGHTRAQFVAVVETLHALGLQLNPTFVAFNPWITGTGYRDLLSTIAELDLIDHVAPIQYAIRLLITAQSPLLALPSIRALIHPFDEQALVYPWNHPDPHVDALQQKIIRTVEEAEKAGQSRREIFGKVWHLANESLSIESLSIASDGLSEQDRLEILAKEKVRNLPKLSEPWYC